MFRYSNSSSLQCSHLMILYVNIPLRYEYTICNLSPHLPDLTPFAWETQKMCKKAREKQGSEPLSRIYFVTQEWIPRWSTYKQYPNWISREITMWFHLFQKFAVRIWADIRGVCLGEVWLLCRNKLINSCQGFNLMLTVRKVCPPWK